MKETKTTFEQFCTHQNKNVVMETTMYLNGEKRTECTNTDCPNNKKVCKNKLKPK